MTAQTAVLTRLSALPRKVGAPLRDLVRNRLMSEKTVETLLDAGELAGQPQHLLGFAAALDELRRKGVQVEDAVRMAKAQRRRISLRWSPKRWRTEHNRMSRTATLRKLAGANTTYELSAYERHLPERWPGYLIRTSRRLGMEGLRQRHCVASYHDLVQQGRQAIAVVFVERQRWTVALTRTGKEEAPLRIAQIRGPHNRCPSPEAVAAVYERLGIPRPTRNPTRTRTRPVGPYLPNLQRALPVLREHGIGSVYVYFSGSGDSGQIETVFFSPSVEGGPRFQIPCDVERAYREGERWARERVVELLPAEEAIRTIADDYLEATDVDWYNDDGGQGHLEIDVEAGSVELEIATNYTERTTQVWRTLDIATGDVLTDELA